MEKNVYSIITEIIIEKLESGIVPWQKPWKNYKDNALVLHQNYVTKKAYKGINQFLLNCSPFNSPYWLSFKQISQAGLKLKKGSKAFPVFYFRPFYTDMDGNIIDIKDAESIEEGNSNLHFMMKYYKVFNASCVEGLENAVFPIQETNDDDEARNILNCEKLMFNWKDKPLYQNHLSKACYYPQLDMINLPKKSAFNTIEEYYSTAFHEMIHATGHENRLNRQNSMEARAFGSENYSKEELVAEMGASFLCGVMGIENRTIDNSAAYIKSWLGVLKGDKKLVVVAASQAEKAANYILENQA